MAKFVVYEKVAEAVYRVYPKKDMSDGMQTVVNLGSGLVAGLAAAVVSQPADTMLSKINKTKAAPGEGTTARLIKIGKELGFRGSFSGLGARLFMVGTLTAFQFAIYGYVFCAVSPFHGSIWLTIFSSDVKRLLGATGGIEIAK
jgi:solute carrier family 25 phosphate transporter 3